MLDPGRNLDLAVVGNCQVAGLIDRTGSIVWMGMPRLDADPVFCRLLMRAEIAPGVGEFSVEVSNGMQCDQRYERNTAIVETLLTDSNGATARIIDFCPRFRARGRMHRPPMLIRIVQPIAGTPYVRIRVQPRAGYGARSATRCSGTSHISYECDDSTFRMTTNASLSALESAAPMRLDTPLYFLLGPDETVTESPASVAESLLIETRRYWLDWVRTLAIPLEWQAAVIRSAITLKLCTFEDTGAVLAALTTSIPESPDSGRNWDYRYCWLRDAYFVVRALNRLGATRTMEGYLRFIDQVVVQSSAQSLQPVYRIDTSPQMPERLVKSLHGFQGMGPVRVGNAAALQAQHDSYGAVILAASQLYFDQRLDSPGTASQFERLLELAATAARVFDQPDAGPWEYRNSVAVHTYSAALCWAGCDRVARIARQLGRPEVAASWDQVATDMRARLLNSAWNDRRKSFTGTLHGRHLDATVLLLADLGVVDAADARFVATVDAVGTELVDGDIVYRYRNSDDFGQPEAGFTICAFWYVDALAAIGRVDEARLRFARLLELCNHVGLLSEDVMPSDLRLWGNFPQTYSMVGIINSALRLSRPWERAF